MAAFAVFQLLILSDPEPSPQSQRPSLMNPRLAALNCLWLILCLAFSSRAGSPAVRKNVKLLSDTEKTNFVRCVLWLKRNPSAYDPGNASGLSAYDWMVKLHKDGFLNHLSGGSGVHMAPSFFPWHREYLRAFEREIQRAAKALGIQELVMLPYWDWTDPESVPHVFNSNFMGGNGAGPNSAFTTGALNTRSTPFRVRTGPFATRDDRTTDFPLIATTNVSGNSSVGPPRPYLQRAIATHQIFGGPSPGGAPPPEYPTTAQITNLPPPLHVQTAMAMTVFDQENWDYKVEIELDYLLRKSFRNYMEGHTGETNLLAGDPFGDQMHGRVHLWVGGSMGASSSPNDPVFWLHHSNLDRIWAEWQDTHGIYNYPAKWFYLDTANEPQWVVASDKLWGFTRSVNYPADVTSLDALDIRATGIRYDTMADSAPASIVARIDRNADGSRVVVTAQSIPGLLYQLESSDLSGQWTRLGKPVSAEGDTVTLTVDLPVESGQSFFRLAVSSPGNQTLVLSEDQKSAWRALLKDPVCGVPAGGWPVAGK